MNLEFLKEDNLLIITTSSYKKSILKYLEDNKLILNIKFMSINEYLKNYFFDYDNKTINYLVNKGLTVGNSKELINNLYYIEDKEYSNEKLDYLVSIKKELDDNGLLTYSPLFKKILDRYKIVVYGYGKINNYYKKILNNPLVIEYPKNNKKYQIYHYNNIDMEVECIFQKIVDLLRNNIDINKISLMNLDDEYIPIIKKYSIFYKIPVNIIDNNSIIGTTIGKEFLSMIKEGKKREDIFKYLDKYQDNSNYITLINILNKYYDMDDIDYKLQIEDEIKSTKIKSINLDNTVKIKDLFDYIEDDEYVFLLNFNNPAIPNLKLDTDYITDNIKELINLDLTEDENSLIKENTLNYLSSIKNLVISYKDKTSFNECYPSILLDLMDHEIIDEERSLNYSDYANKSYYTEYLDDFIKYGIKNNLIDKLYYNYHDNDYLKYHNDYSSITTLSDYIKNSLTLSYTSINSYYECAFKYYLGNILKINKFETNFTALLGTYFHKALENIDNNSFDLDSYTIEFINDNNFSNKEKYFIEKIKKDLLYVIETVKHHHFISGFKNFLMEQNVNIVINKDPLVKFNGYVDKIMYEEKNNETLISVIDYKTGSVITDIKNLQFGLSMQLPIYLYLVEKSNLFHNPKFAGFYLMHVLDNKIKKGKKSFDEQKKDNLKLVGYTTDNLDRVSIFDSTYEKSEMIKGFKLTKDGNIDSRSKVLSDDEMNNIINLTEEKIIEAKDNILKANFSINPKILDGKNISCKFCDYFDICYHNDSNNVYLNRDMEEGEDDE